MARILVVDDEGAVREMIAEFLALAGHEVVTAGDGTEGLDRIAGGAPDLIVTDLLMPKLGGLGFIGEVRRKLPDVRIIAISGGDHRGGAKFLSVARTFPGVRTLNKPFRRRDLLDLVRELLDGG